MPFGQQSGPPASARQVRELLTLIQGAGHTDFRDARGPMDFTQRQAAGKFTSDEAAAFIDQLQGGELEATPPAPAEQAVGDLPTEQLVAELERRGWTISGRRAAPPSG